MNNADDLIKKLNEREVCAIREAHLYAWSQMRVMFLVMSYISDLTNNRVTIEERNIKLYGYLIHSSLIQETINQVKLKGPELEQYFYTMAKNLFRGTTHPVFEISHNGLIKDLLTVLFFRTEDHFKRFLGISTIIRHFLSHNYTTKVVLKKWDTKGDDLKNLIKEYGNKVDFQYVGKELFPEVYSDSDFKIDISLDLSSLKVGQSLFDAIEIKQLLFLGELCNNCLSKLNSIINRTLGNT